MLQRSCKIDPFYCSEMALPRNHLWNESEGTEQKKPTCQHSTFIHFQPDILHQIFVPGMIVGTLLPEFWREQNLWVLKVVWKGSVSSPACYFTQNIFQFYWESFFSKLVGGQWEWFLALTNAQDFPCKWFSFETKSSRDCDVLVVREFSLDQCHRFHSKLPPPAKFRQFRILHSFSFWQCQCHQIWDNQKGFYGFIQAGRFNLPLVHLVCSSDPSCSLLTADQANAWSF